MGNWSSKPDRVELLLRQKKVRRLRQFSQTRGAAAGAHSGARSGARTLKGIGMPYTLNPEPFTLLYKPHILDLLVLSLRL